MAPKIDKGKAPARSETTPLLADRNGASSSHGAIAHDATRSLTAEELAGLTLPPRHRPTWSETARTHVLTLLVVVLTILLGLCLFLILLLYSYVPSEKERDGLSNALHWAGPDRVEIVNVTEDGVWVEVAARVGIDTDGVLGIRRGRDEVDVANGERGGGSEWWEDVRARFGSWLLYRVGAVEVQVPAVDFYSETSSSRDVPVLSIISPTNISIPLNNTPPRRNKDPSVPLTPITILAKLSPISHPGELLGILKDGWNKGWVSGEVRVANVTVRVRQGEEFWRKWLETTMRDISLVKRFEIPELPNLPPPGSDLSSLIHLESYSFHTDPQPDSHARVNTPENSTDTLGLSAIATIPNFLPDIRFQVPYIFGFGIFLPLSPVNDTQNSTGALEMEGEFVKMAEVVTLPVSLNGQNPIVIRIEGNIVGDLNEGKTSSNDTALSAFLRNYLHGKPNMVTVRGLSHTPLSSLAPLNASPTPSWILNILPEIVLAVSFPSPDPPPKLIRSITIENMKITELGGKMRASGIVKAEVMLPEQMSGVQIGVNGVKPDVLIFDGLPPPSDEDLDPDTPPYPPKAFGRIHPEEYLEATSETSPFEPRLITVRAPIRNQEVDILPGRDSVLSDFVKKLIFKGGALAGIKGNAGVQVKIKGVRNAVAVDNVPVTGDFVVGKPRK